MKTKKLLAIIICVVVLLVSLASCKTELTPEQMHAKAALGLLDTPYVLSMTMEYNCDDEFMQSVFDTMSGMETEVNVDGKDLSMSMNVMDQEVTYVFCDKVMYIDMMGTKIKTQLNEEQLKEQYDSLMGSAANEYDLEMFESYEAVKDEDGGVTITAKGIKGSAADMINGALGDMDDQEGVSVSVDTENIEIIFVIDNECNYKSVNMLMTMIMTVEGYGSINIDLKMSTTYDYENAKEVTPPADADEYTEMPYDQVAG